MVAARIGTKEPVRGELLYNYSNPLGVKGVWKEGTFTGWTWVWMFAERVGTLDIYPGSSGSGVFNTSGELVGLVNGMSFSLKMVRFLQFEIQKNSLSIPLAHILVFI
jgi:S1-C subfamily serine protease